MSKLMMEIWLRWLIRVDCSLFFYNSVSASLLSQLFILSLSLLLMYRDREEQLLISIVFEFKIAVSVILSVSGKKAALTMPDVGFDLRATNMLKISEKETAETLLTVDEERIRMVAKDLAVSFGLASLLYTAESWPILLQLRHSFPASG